MNFFQSHQEIAFFLVFCLSCLGCAAVIRIGRHTAELSSKKTDLKAVQAMHDSPTPRVGGVFVVAAFAAGVALSIQQIHADILSATLAGLFVFAVGVREDIRRDMSPRIRLFAAFASTGLAVVFSSIMVRGLGLPGVDWVYGMLGVPLAVTLIWSAGFCHALNLIDGVNGLASSYAIATAMAFFAIAGFSGQPDIQLFCLLLSGALAGFFVLNWPFGKIFLGDAGAYMIGHILSWTGIILMFRDSDVAGFSVLLVLFWPVADTATAIIRRKIYKLPTDRPDKMHFHHVVMRAIGVFAGGRVPRARLNPLAAVILFPLFSMPILAGVLLWNRPIWALVAYLVFLMLFGASYVFACYHASHVRKRGLLRFVLARLHTDRSSERVSRLSATYTVPSGVVDMQIIKDLKEGVWTIEVLDEDTCRHSWTETFPTDQAAWRAFNAAMRTPEVDLRSGQRHPENTDVALNEAHVI